MSLIRFAVAASLGLLLGCGAGPGSDAPPRAVSVPAVASGDPGPTGERPVQRRAEPEGRRYELARCSVSAIFPAEPLLATDAPGAAIYELVHEGVEYRVVCPLFLLELTDLEFVLQGLHDAAIMRLEAAEAKVVRSSETPQSRRTALTLPDGGAEVQSSIVAERFPIGMVIRSRGQALPSERAEQFFDSLQP